MSRRWLSLLLIVGVLGYAVYHFTRPAPGTPSVSMRFTDVTAASGIRFTHVNGATGKKLLPETMSGGVAVVDFDRDGKPDLFFANGRPWPGQPGKATQALYRNKGDGTFEDVSQAAGLGVELYAMGVAVGDIDNDGWPDLFITAVGGNRLFRNMNGKRFEDISEFAGFGKLPSWNGTFDDFIDRAEAMSFPASAAFLDYDNDGKLDLFVCNYLTWSPASDLAVKAVLAGGVRAYVPPQQFPGTHCQLFRNVGGERFEDVSVAAGVQVAEARGPVGKSLGVVVCDPDRDGWPDLVVANDTERNFFFHNVRGKFMEEGRFSGLAYADGRPRGGMGIDAADDLIVVANFSNEPNSLFKRVGVNPLRFADTAGEAALVGPSRSPMKFGALFADFNLDGHVDLFTCNGHLEPDIAIAQAGQTYKQPAQLFRGNADFELQDTPFPPMVGRGCAYLDYDGDGHLDLILVENGGPARLFRNDEPPSPFIRLNLVGKTVNRDAIGAEIEIDGKRWFVSPTHGYLSQCERTATFGGVPDAIERVTVRWPGGKLQEWKKLKAGETHELIEAK
jgi:hypothetical protein